MDDVAGGDRLDRAVDVDEQAAARRRRRPRCRRASPSARSTRTVRPSVASRSRYATARLVEVGEPRLVAGEERGEQLLAGRSGVPPSRLHAVAMPSSSAGISGQSTFTPIPTTTASPVGLGEDPGELAVADEQVVRPLQRRRRRRWSTATASAIATAAATTTTWRSSGASPGRSSTETRSDAPGRRGPRPAEPAPAGLLVVGDDDEAVRRARPAASSRYRFVESVSTSQRTSPKRGRSGLRIGHGP